MTLDEAAKVLGVSERTLRRRIDRGEIAAVAPPTGRGQWVHPDALDAYVRTNSRVGR